MLDSFAVGYSVPVFYYTVTIDGVEFSVTEISGLDSETEVIESRFGNSPDFSKRKQAGLVKWPDLVIKKGFFAGDDRKINIFNQLFDKDYYTELDTRFEVLVELWDEHGQPVQTWTFINCIPKKLGGTSLKSDGNELYFESLEISHEGMKVQLG
jgi:phage tail-like protein